MKTYSVKTYNIDWSYKETINPDHIINEIQFSWSMNWWLWQLQIQTDYAFADTSYKGGEFVKVCLFDEFHDKDVWKQIYYGFISRIQRKTEESREYTVFTCLWVWSLLKNILYECYNKWKYCKWYNNNTELDMEL